MWTSSACVDKNVFSNKHQQTLKQKKEKNNICAAETHAPIQRFLFW